MLLEPLVSTIETIKERIDVHGPSLRASETRTRMALIDPLLQALGWDTSDPAMVLPEYDVSGRKADYALLDGRGRPSATLEAKKLGEPLAPHRMQMLNYSNASDVEYAGLTDGDKWELYEVFSRGQLEDRRVLDLSIAETPAPEAALKLLLLWRRNLASGQPVAANAPVLDTFPSMPLISSAPIMEAISTSQITQQAVPSSVSTAWTPLSSADPNKSSNPPPHEIRFATGETRPVKYWWNVLAEVAEWLVRNQHLTVDGCPISGLNFIDSVARDRRAKQVSGGIYLNVTLSASILVKNSNKLLTHFGVNPETVELRFE